jgi:GNAT-family acetyltransferase (TIGR03103 family)
MTARRDTAKSEPVSQRPDSSDRQAQGGAPKGKSDAVVDCGWGRLIFGQTFETADGLAEIMAEERPEQRDVAFYVKDPHVVLASAPQSLFLDPSHSFRLDLTNRRDRRPGPVGDFVIRPARSEDEDAINRLYLSRNMVPVAPGFCARLGEGSAVTVLVAEDPATKGDLMGVVMGVDHRLAFDDPDWGSSLWALAVDPQALRPGVGAALVADLADRFAASGCAFMDLSVIHDNREAIALYEKFGFERIPIYCIKRKNPINEKLFLGPQPDAKLNIYAQIIVDEARRRGITVDIEDGVAGLFKLSLGGRAVSCRESLSDLTSAVALSRCDDKRLTRRLLERAELRVPAQITGGDEERVREFLETHGSVVVKPARGEMGRGISVDLRTIEDVSNAIVRARALCDDVLVEQFVEGSDLRIIVIDGAVVAAAVRRPPRVQGDGVHTIIELIDKQSRRREAATDGESTIPLDEETERCVVSNDYQMLDVPPKGETVTVRKTANLHAGGTIHDVTADLHPELAKAAVRGAEVLGIPVVGFDFIVPDPSRSDYVIIEANERPGLANHEPQPTVERFIDYLFPQTRAETKSKEAET